MSKFVSIEGLKKKTTHICHPPCEIATRKTKEKQLFDSVSTATNRSRPSSKKRSSEWNRIFRVWSHSGISYIMFVSISTSDKRLALSRLLSESKRFHSTSNRLFIQAHCARDRLFFCRTRWIYTDTFDSPTHDNIQRDTRRHASTVLARIKSLMGSVRGAFRNPKTIKKKRTP